MRADFYRHNTEYAAVIDALPEHAFRKYINALADGTPLRGHILDIGCGTGKVVEALDGRGFRAVGIEISEASLAYCVKRRGSYALYDGSRIPHAGNTFDTVGSCNVFEHTEDPALFLEEAWRVLKPGGTFVLSCPNFLRVIGLRDYHPRMRGFRHKWRNMQGIARRLRRENADVSFECMPFIPQSGSHQADNDATVVSNALDLTQWLRAQGAKEISVSCVDRIVAKPLAWILDATPLKYVMLNVFIVARKPHA